MIKVFYYYYYLFYTRIIPDDEPHATVIWTLSLSIANIIIFFLAIAIALSFRIFLNKWIMIMIFCVVLVSMYFTLFRTEKGVCIIKEKPRFLQSNRLSIIITILFFLVSIAPVFVMVPIIKQILSLNM